MSELEWLTCEDPDLLLEAVDGKVNRQDLVDFVRQCWERITSYLPPVPSDYTVVDEFAALAFQLSDHDAVLFAAEAALKAARWAPALKAERKQQAELLREIIPQPA